ncbi:MAG: Lysyl-tRNA synthetase, partial [Parcubacteria group bacterium Greene0416_79]
MPLASRGSSPGGNNGNGGGGKTPAPRRDLFNNALTALFIFLLLMTVYSFIAENRSADADIPLSQVAADVMSGDVSAISIKGDTLEVVYAKGKITRRSKKEPGSALSETLSNYGVPVEILQKVQIGVERESGFAFWVMNLAPFIIPILFIVAFIWFLTRQIRGAGMQAFTFGQSKPS